MGGRVARDEAERFFSHVVRGPDPTDCWIWTGAISDDGYGRFWLNRNGRNVAVRPSRFAHTLITGQVLPSSVMLLHTCDVPLCVHVDTDPALSHLFEGDGRMNMLDRSQKGRARNRWNSLGWRGISRRQRVERSRALRAAILTHGWDRERIRAAINGVDPSTPALF